MKITEFPAVTKLAESDVFIKDGDGGTKKIAASDMILALLDLVSSENHRMIFRGKNLGSSLTAEQLAAIQDGSFTDLWLGDYWEIAENKWRIVDFDYYYNRGDTPTTQHHIVVMPDDILYKAVMNNSATTTGAYFGSTMYNTNIVNAKSIATLAFGEDNILTFRNYYYNSMSNGHPNYGLWADSTISLPTENMMYGTNIFSARSEGTTSVDARTLDFEQLALFNVSPKFVKGDVDNSTYMWLRDTAGSGAFTCVGNSGHAVLLDANSPNGGVRPYILLG